MKALAVVTVVFLPLTLIASIYGTNFDEHLPAVRLGARLRGHDRQHVADDGRALRLLPLAEVVLGGRERAA